MKKKLLILAILFIFICTAVGCAKVTDMTDEQNNLVAEYAAGALVRKSFSYKLKYPDLHTPAETEDEGQTGEEQTTPSDAQETTPAEGETSPVPERDDIGELLGIAPIKVIYKDYKIVDEYPDDPDAMLTFKPQDGCKFIILEFTLHNPTGKDVTVNTAKTKPVIRATINNKRGSNYANMMLNDITNLDDVLIGAGENFDGIIVFMAEEKVLSKIDSFVITMRIDNSNVELVKIK